MNKSLATVLSVGFTSFVALSAFVACSSSSNNGNGGGGGAGSYSLTNCPNEAMALSTATGCVSCMQSKCSSQLSTVTTSCQAQFDCACPSGADAQACPSGNEPDGGPGACAQALGTLSSTGATGLFACVFTNCLAACTPTDGG
jgi:hypothetical protein